MRSPEGSEDTAGESESEKRFQLFMRHLPGVAFIKDAVGRYVFVNELSSSVMGRPVADMLGRTDEELFPPETAAMLRENDAKVFRDGVVHQTVEVIPGREGPRDWLVTLFPMSGSGQDLLGGIGFDVTDRVRAEERFRQIAENIDEVFWTGDNEKTTYVSPRFEAVWGRSTEEALARPGVWLESLHTEDRERVTRALEARTSDARYDVEYRIVRPDGTVRWIHDRGFPVRSDTAFRTHWVGIAEDVTTRTEAELELRLLSERLRALTSRLDSIREEESRRIAREVHDELGHFLLSLKLEMVQLEKSLDPKRIAPMKHLVDSTITTIRRIASSLHPAILDFGLPAAIDWCVNDFAKRAGLRILSRLPRTEPQIPSALATALFRVLQEALSNVSRHAGATTVRVVLAVTRWRLTLCITDDGQGILPGDQLRIGSLGILGMKERILPFGGEVRVERRKRKGTSVTVSVPTTQGAPKASS